MVVRLYSTMNKKDGISQEEFHRYWREEHGKLFASLDIVKKNLVKYEQAHVNEFMKPIIDTGAYPSASWGGLAIFEAESYDKIMEVFGSEEYQRVVHPDEAVFLDVENRQLFAADLVIFNLDKHLPV